MASEYGIVVYAHAGRVGMTQLPGKLGLFSCYTFPFLYERFSPNTEMSIAFQACI